MVVNETATEILESIAKPDNGGSIQAIERLLREFSSVNLKLPLEEFLSRQEKWDRRFLELAEHVSSWSKDPSTKVGAVIVDSHRRVVGTGYNGFARGVKDTEARYDDRPTKYKLVVHAELNAVITAGDRCMGGTIYVFPAFGCPPLCSSCAKAVIQSGIIRVVGWVPDIDDATAARWKEELDAAYLMCNEAGIEMTMLTP